MQPKIVSKLPNVGTTIFSVMSQLAGEHDAINLSQGFPDFQPPTELVREVNAALLAGHNQYAPMPGVPALRESIARLLRQHYGVHADPATEITVTSGATEALFAAIHCVVQAGDEVVLFDPSYDSYIPAIELAGGIPVRVPLRNKDFGIDWALLEDALNEKTRLVIINSPHNPSGALLSANDLEQLAAAVRNYNCFILSDEVYEHIVFDGHKHATALAQAELKERCFAVFSFGKTFHATGWKVGYCVAPGNLTAELRRIHQYLTFATTTPIQYAIATYLDSHPEHYQTLGSFYARKRDQFRELLETSAFKLLPCEGTYFQLADYGAIAAMPDVEFCRWLTIQHGVAAIPISVFSARPRANQTIVRFCFAKETETLAAAAARLTRVSM